MLGREGGVCGGKGGSQHLCADDFYSNGILGRTVPLATGIALAEREKRQGAIATVFIGDGTLGQGVVYESLNNASLWKLPLLVVVENNGVRAVDAVHAPDRRRRRGARGGLRHRDRPARLDRRARDQRAAAERVVAQSARPARRSSS